jgi:hypothetical protein
MNSYFPFHITRVEMMAIPDVAILYFRGASEYVFAPRAVFARISLTVTAYSFAGWLCRHIMTTICLSLFLTHAPRRSGQWTRDERLLPPFTSQHAA